MNFTIKKISQGLSFPTSQSNDPQNYDEIFEFRRINI